MADSKTKALHLLNRFTYGPLHDQAENLAKKGDVGLRQWFEQQLNSRLRPEKKIDEKLKDLKSLQYSSQQILQYFPKPKKAANALAQGKMMNMAEVEGGPKDVLKELVIQKIVRAAESENQLEEVLLDFWFNHFNVYFDKGAVRHQLTSYERDSIRPFIFSKFQDLLISTAKSPAMLFYLDNFKSHKGQINENYGRELLELHTLGVDGGYTQADIQNAARALTGWGIDKPNEISEFKFFKKQHDTESKKIMDLELPAGGSFEEGEKLLRYLARHKSTASFIAKKLCVKFVSDTPSQKSIDHLAAVFLKTDGDLKEVYREIFRLEEFWSSTTLNSKIKTPFEYLISSVRALNADVLAQPERLNILKNFFDQSGQSLYRCQPPTGYKAVSEYWVNPGALVNRINLALKLTRNEIPQIDFNKNKLLEPIANNKYREQIDLLSYFNQHIFNGVVKKTTLTQLDQLVNDSKNYQDEVKRELPLHYFQVEKLLGLMLSSPEFQRR
jgi:uncharacterized protein (DUF1800 family)